MLHATGDWLLAGPTCCMLQWLSCWQVQHAACYRDLVLASPACCMLHTGAWLLAGPACCMPACYRGLVACRSNMLHATGAWLWQIQHAACYRGLVLASPVCYWGLVLADPACCMLQGIGSCRSSMLQGLGCWQVQLAACYWLTQTETWFCQASSAAPYWLRIVFARFSMHDWSSGCQPQVNQVVQCRGLSENSQKYPYIGWTTGSCKPIGNVVRWVSLCISTGQKS